MICILSQTGLEHTTEAVSQWLRGWGLPVVRMNGSDLPRMHGPIVTISASATAGRMEVDGQIFDPSDVTVVWYRRWGVGGGKSRVRMLVPDGGHDDPHLRFIANEHLVREMTIVSEAFFSTLRGAAWLSDPATVAPNKLRVLQQAVACGLDVPETLITADVDEVRRFKAKHGAIVSKAASDGIICPMGDRSFAVYTSDVPDELLEGDAPWRGGFPSLFQERLHKRYEIRSFYLNGRIDSMAMFSQHHEETSVDFRRYQYDAPTRSVPYLLPSSIADALDALMRALRLQTGSIDLVRTVDDRFVFLEVNPIGQFGMTSFPCNYFLEKRVATFLAELHHGTNTASPDCDG